MNSFAQLEGSSVNTNNESKYYNMKQFINASRIYMQNKTESTLNLMNRHLQLLSVTLDLSTFDPHTSVVSEFFVNLYQFLSNVEQRSAWACVNVLTIACRNPAARNALIHTYQFLPLLAKLLGDQLTAEKKIKLLTLMQELSCGIKISWQIPHLPHLMSTLIRWIESKEEEEVVALSLAILVNLCYKNLPAIYTLSRCVDIKKFLRICMPLKGFKIEVHVCKLLVILDYMNEKIPEEACLKLIKITFKSLIGAFVAKDAVLLRHVVEFFLDMWQTNAHTEILLKFPNYDEELEKVLQVIETTPQSGGGDMGDQGTECMALLFEFFHFFIEQLQKLTPLYSRLVNVALKWLQSEFVCSSALTILRTIAVKTAENENTVLEPFLMAIPVFILTINNRDEEIATNIESNKRLTVFMELLRALVQIHSTRNKVLETLKEKFLLRIFTPLLGNKESPRIQISNTNAFSIEAVSLYINTIALIDELVKYNPQWLPLYTNLIAQKQIHMVLAHGMYGGSKEVKVLIMRMSANNCYPIDKIATAMSELQPLIDSNNINNCNQQVNDNFCIPLMSVTQLQRLDEVMNKLKEACDDHNQFVNISTSNLMELYEYKLATMGYAEQAAIANLEAASQRCTHLQHRIAQLTTEHSRLHQLLLHSQQCYEDATKTRDELIENNTQLQQWSENELAIKMKIITEKSEQLEEALKRIQKQEVVLEKHNELKMIVGKLEDNLRKNEKLVQKRDEQVASLNTLNEHLKLEITQLKKQVEGLEVQLHNKSKQLAEVSQNLDNCKQILGTITQLTSNSPYSM